jgi:RNA polymerase sigma-70 factor (ECF subfamily)
MGAAQDRAHLTASDEDFEEVSNHVSEALSDRIEENLSVQQQLESALAQISPTYAAVLLMIKRDGMSYEEVAAKMGLSLHSVHKYLQRARAELKRRRWEGEDADGKGKEADRCKPIISKT